MEIFNDYLVQLGSVGIIILGLLYFSKYMFSFSMNKMREEAEENKKLNDDFRIYLIHSSKEQLVVLKKNAEASEKATEIMDKLYDYLINDAKDQSNVLKKNIQAYNRMTEVMDKIHYHLMEKNYE